MLAHRDAAGGYFTFVLQPKVKYKTGDIAPREVILLIDHSGSMSGGPLDDVMNGGSGDDTMFGNFGSDTMFGGSGDDLVDGDNNNPIPPGGPPFPPGTNNDACTGNSGTNIVVNCEILL